MEKGKILDGTYMEGAGQPQFNNTDQYGTDLIITPENNNLEQVIDTALVKHNITEAIINELKERYLPLKLLDLNDKQGYMVINDARKHVKSFRVITEKTCKQGRADAIAVQKKWIEKEKEIVGKISEVEDHLQGEVDRFDAEQKRIEDEKKKLIEDQYIIRQQELTMMGAKYSDGSFIIGDVSFEATLIKESDDSIWNETMLPKYKAKYESIEQLRIAEEKKKKEDQEKLDAERKKFDEDQRIFKDQQESFKKQQEEIAQRQMEIDLQKAKEETQKKRKRETERIDSLISIGMSYTKNGCVCEDILISENDISNMEDEQWNKLVKETEPIIKKRKELFEEKRKSEAEAEEERIKLKAIEDEKERKRLEEIKAKEEAAKADDKTKWEAFLNLIKGLELPVMKSGPYRSKMVMVREKIDEIIEL